MAIIDVLSILLTWLFPTECLWCGWADGMGIRLNGEFTDQS
jgi:hypothetical protein